MASTLLPDVSSALQGILPSGAAVAVGMALRKSGIVTEVDAITMRRLATFVTCPCLFLHVLGGPPPLPLPLSSVAAVAVVYALSVMLPAILTWASTKYMHPKERGVLAGLSLGSSVELFALPVVVGITGGSPISIVSSGSDVMIYTACLVAVLNMLTTQVLAPLYFSTAGPAFPKDFKHTDGGVYNGEWKGALKDGFGVYTYPSGARYEGEWLDGTKEGRGVYKFPKGGIYEGEWRNGKMEGVGVRTYASGKVSSGLWEGGKLVKSIDESQCALVVANANEAALCAKNVFVGGMDGGELVRGVLTQPGLLVGLASLVAGVLGASGAPVGQLPAGVGSATRELAKAHGVLSLVGFGMLLDRTPVEARQMTAITQMIATRVVPGLVVYAAAAIALPATLPAASICALALATVSPMSYRTLELTHVFRLNENLVAAASRYSVGISVACTGAILLAARRAATTASVAELSYGMGMIALCLWLVMSFWSESAQKARAGGEGGNFYKRTIKMVYKGAGAGAGTAGGNPMASDGRDDGPPSSPPSGTATAAYRRGEVPTTTTTTTRMVPKRRPVFTIRNGRPHVPPRTHPRLFQQQRIL